MPDLSELSVRLKELENYYLAYQARCYEDDPYYEGTFLVPLPGEEGEVIKVVPPTGRNAIDVPATHIVTDRPLIKRRREVHDAKQQLDDDAVEAFLKAFLESNDDNSPTPTLQEITRYQLLRGMGIPYGPFFNIELWKKGAPAHEWLWYDTIDPMEVLIEPGPNPRQAFIVSKMTIAEILQEQEYYKKWSSFDATAYTATQEVEIVEWWGWDSPDDKYVSYACFERNRSWLDEPMETRYPYLPVDAIYSGYGMRSRHSKIENVAVSILNAQVKTLLKEECYALSVSGAVMGAAAWERYQYDPAITEIDKANLEYAPGSLSSVPTGMVRIEPPDIPSAVLQHYGNVRGSLQDALFSGVVQGQRPEGVSTASGLAMLQGQARLKFGPPLRLLQAGTTRLLAKVGMLLESVSDYEKGDVEFEIMGRKLKASQFHKDYYAKVLLLAEDPVERQDKIGLGLTLIGKAPLKWITSEFWGIEDYSQFLEDMMYEKVVTGDEMAQALAQFLQLDKAGGDSQGKIPGQEPSPLNMLKEASSIARANRPGGLEQQKALPGTMEALAGAMVPQNGQGGIGGGANGQFGI